MPRNPVKKAAPTKGAKPKKTSKAVAAKAKPKYGIIQLPTDLLEEATELVPTLRVAFQEDPARDAVRWTRTAVARVAIREGLALLREKYGKGGK